jgi:hypothetical protein
MHLPPERSDAADRLRALENAVRSDLEVLKYPSVPLPYERRADVLEVAIIGGGQNGKAMAFGLRRHGCHNVKVFDRNPKGLQGPWRTYARNHLLRTDKDSVGGLDWGFPNLHFQRWADAKFGEDYYRSIRKIPRVLWAEYLDWYGGLLNLPIEYNVWVKDIAWRPASDCFELQTSRGQVQAQFVVVCTGIESAGNGFIPPLVQDNLPADVYAHTMEDIPAEKLESRDVVVMGGGAGAFDTANVALRAGARSVDLMVRRPNLPAIHRVCWGSKWDGYHRHYIELPDHVKWAYSLADLELGVPPPRHTYYEAIGDDRFRIYGSAGIDALCYRGERIFGVYGGSEFSHDFMVCGTGSRNSLADQDELKSISPLVRLWKDVYLPNGMATRPELELSPYLGKALQFLPKDLADEFVSRVYYLCSGVAHLSGFRCNLSALQYAASRVCHDISRSLFLMHAPEVKQAFDEYSNWE